ncbi:hypothetical protein [Streptomyces sp. NPDC093598]|uniref:hypothetical protein n=1 Tax=Streptomyces sp. NPDC093598 TaxID=3366046 RepID=UPI00380FAE43
MLGIVLCRLSRQRADRPGGLLLVPTGALVALLGPFALVALMAHVQGAAAPFAPLLPMLTGGGADGELTAPSADPAAGGRPPHRPALARAAMISDSASAILAGLALVTAVANTTSAAHAPGARRLVRRGVVSHRASWAGTERPTVQPVGGGRAAR